MGPSAAVVVDGRPSAESDAKAPATSDAMASAASEQIALLESLFARHMRARAMLRSVVKAEQEAIAEIIWTLKAVPASRRQEIVALCVERAAAGLIRDTD